MKIFGNIIRFPTRRSTENALDVVRVDQKTNNLFIVNLSGSTSSAPIGLVVLGHAYV